MYRVCLTLLGLLCFTLPAWAQTPTPKKYALLIAVTTYEHVHLNQAPKIQYPENDATAIGAVLEASGYEVELLLGEKATKAAIDRSLAQLAKKGNQPGVVLIGLFGHGVEYDELAADGTPTSRSYFCPYDTTMRNRLGSDGKITYIAKDKPRIEPDPTGLISISQIFSAMSLSPAGNRVLLADCCRNDPHALRGAKRGFGTGVKSGDLPENANTAALFACSKGEQAMEDPTSQHGAFTKCVLDWLADPMGGRTAGRLGEHLDEAVPKLVSDLTMGDLVQQPKFLNAGRVDLQLASLTPAKVAPPQPTPPATPSVPLTGRYTSKSTGMTFEPIPAGTLLMGSSAADVAAYLKADPSNKPEDMTAEQPQHSVRITRPFSMGTYEVTQGEYQKITGRNPSYFSATGDGKEKVTSLDTTRFPVEQISWYDAVEYCNLLSEADGLTPYYTITAIERNDGQSIKSATVTPASGSASAPRGYRLPTEAEWEYASRAGTTTAFWFGSQNNGKEANVDGNYPFGTTTKGPNLGRTTTVGQYAKNKFGLYDTVGNTMEWCGDVFDEKAYAGRTGTTDDPEVNVSTEDRRVLRGGSWNYGAGGSRSADRSGNSPVDRYYSMGFRVVRTQ